MSKLLILLSLLTLVTFSYTTIFAKSDNSKSSNNSSSHGSSQSEVHGNGNGNNKDSEVEDGNEVKNEHGSSSSAQISPTCAPEAQWKNHGDYVSCVAHLHQGGQAVSEAAKSDVGKKHASASASLKPSPSSSSSASPSFTPNPSASESASPSATLANTVIVQQFAAIGELIKDFLKNLRHLLPF